MTAMQPTPAMQLPATDETLLRRLAILKCAGEVLRFVPADDKPEAATLLDDLISRCTTHGGKIAQDVFREECGKVLEGSK